LDKFIDLLATAGAGCVTYGIYLYEPRLAWIVAGVFLIIFAVIGGIAVGRRGNANEKPAENEGS